MNDRNTSSYENPIEILVAKYIHSCLPATLRPLRSSAPCEMSSSVVVDTVTRESQQAKPVDEYLPPMKGYECNSEMRTGDV